MPVLGIIFLKYMYLRFKDAEAKINKNRLVKDGIACPIDEHDFVRMGAIKLPEEAQFKWIEALPADIASKRINNNNYQTMQSLGEVLNNAMSLIEERSEQLAGILYKEYNKLSDSILRNLLEVFAREDIDNDTDCLGEVYEYFLGNFDHGSKSDKGVFFTPRSLVQMIVNVLEPKRGTVLDPACGSGGMFVQIKNYMEKHKLDCSKLMTFYGHELIDYHAKLCLMNIIIHGLNGKVAYGDVGNTYFYDPFNLDGKCDYVLANPPFNVDGVNAASAIAAGRLPFGVPKVSKKEISNANFLWVSYFYSYLNEKGKAGFVMPSIAMGGGDNQFRSKIVETKHVDLLINVAPKFFQSGFKAGCSLWFFNKQKLPEHEDKILFIDASEYFTPLGDKQNIWNDWQLKNLNAVVWLYRGQKEEYRALLKEYRSELKNLATQFEINVENDNYLEAFENYKEELIADSQASIDNAGKHKKQIKKFWDEKQRNLENGVLIAKEYHWIYSKFGEGEYKNILGFCKAVDLKEVREKNYSLIPGIYVGVSEEEREDEASFMQRMENMHRELADLERESNELMARIQRNMELWKK